MLFHYPHSIVPYPHAVDTADLDPLTALNTSHLCDRLHQLTARLQLSQRAISRLGISIKFLDTHMGPLKVLKSTQLFPAVKSLLNPFRRLRQIDSPEILSVTINNSQNLEMNILLPGRMDPGTIWAYDDHLKQWCRDLSSSQVSPRFMHILEDYWRLANLVSSITGRYCAYPKIWRFTELLEAAKIARDKGNLEALRKIWDGAVALWLSYLDDHDAFQSRVTESILASSMCR
jgi:hypothetical protein